MCKFFRFQTLPVALPVLCILLLCGCGGGSSTDTSLEAPVNPVVVTGVDADGDGYLASQDCDDASATIYPSATETCNGLDDDCDGAIDEDDACARCYVDADDDGYGSATLADQDLCLTSTEISFVNTDCDDANAAVHPDAAEIAFNSVDDDCDAATSDNPSTWYCDGDNDGYGDSSCSTTNDTQPTGYVVSSSDCDDSVADTNPGASEKCDDIDNDCNGVVDDHAADATTWYRDADNDGYGKILPFLPLSQPLIRKNINLLSSSLPTGTGPLASLTKSSCDQPTGYVAKSGDCNDSDATIHPGADDPYTTDGVDQDCDGAEASLDATVCSTPTLSHYAYYGDPTVRCGQGASHDCSAALGDRKITYTGSSDDSCSGEFALEINVPMGYEAKIFVGYCDPENSGMSAEALLLNNINTGNVIFTDMAGTQPPYAMEWGTLTQTSVNDYNFTLSPCAIGLSGLSAWDITFFIVAVKDGAIGDFQEWSYVKLDSD